MEIEIIKKELKKINKLRKDFSNDFSNKDFEKRAKIHNKFFKNVKKMVKQLEELESIEIVNTKVYKNKEGVNFIIFEEKTEFVLCIYNKEKTKENIFIDKNLINDEIEEEIDENRALLFFYYNDNKSKLFNISQKQYEIYKNFLNNNSEVNVVIFDNIESAEEYKKSRSGKTIIREINNN